MPIQSRERASRSPRRGGTSIPAGLLLGVLLASGVPCRADEDEASEPRVDTASLAPADFTDTDVPHDGTPPASPALERPLRLPDRIRERTRADRKATKTVAGRGRRAAPRRGLPAPGIVDIPAGCFRMGSAEGAGAENERPRHEVCLSAFRLDRLPVLQSQFEEVAGSAPWTLCEGPNCAAPDPDHPAWYVTWSEADSFCRAKGGRLPTEAEFEYAARAGDSSLYLWGDSLADACAHANLADLSLSKATPGWSVFPCRDGHALVAPAGGRKPNRWGLYDMAGNVWQWTSDWYAGDWYSRSPRQDPVGPAEGTGRVMRGGSWMNGPTGGRVAYRDGFRPDERYSGAIGFRCAYLPR